MDKIVIHELELGHLLDFVQQFVLPGAVGVRGLENFPRLLQGFGTLYHPAVFARSTSSRRGKARYSERFAIRLVGYPGVLDTCSTIVELTHFVVAESIHVVLV